MVILLDKGDSLSWALVPEVLSRVRKFIKDYGGDNDPRTLSSIIQQHFISDRPMMIMAAGIADGKVVGHALASIDELTGRRWLTILQLDVDKEYRKVISPEFDEGWKKLLDWGRSNYATEVQLLTSTESRARMFERRFGLNKHRILMRGVL